MLPGYDGFHGVLMHDNEIFKQTAQHGDHKSNTTSSDFLDYIKWLQTEQSVSKLNRFKQLQNEVLLLEKNHVYKNLLINTTRSSDGKTQETLNERLSFLIEQIESDEKHQKHSRKDL